MTNWDQVFAARAMTPAIIERIAEALAGMNARIEQVDSSDTVVITDDQGQEFEVRVSVQARAWKGS